VKDGQIAGMDLGEAKKIDDLCKQFTLSVSSPANAGQTRQIGRELDTLVMQPVRSLLGGRTEILVSPDGSLNLIPFAALIDENNNYLVEQYQFTYLGTSRDLVRLEQPSVRRQPAVIVANPAFGASEGPSGCRFEARSGFTLEATAIAVRLPNAEKLVEDNASKSRLRALAGPQILHVATHGFFDLSGDCVAKDASPMLRSGLAVAGANNRNGIMTALEIADLDLWSTQLVVLSACETGVGEARDGEGVFGMRRALVIAGSRTQVISLWEVDDESTRDLMVAYYDRLLAGAGRSAALRAVQLEMLKDGRDPSSWAAFIPSGDWTPLGR
jgi:CHAT domain-containing protein